MKETNGIMTNDDELLDPKIDFCFKQIFGNNETNFINFTNDILKLEGNKKIEHATFINIELPPDKDDDKESRLDVLATLTDKTTINIEIQCKNLRDFEKRSLYYFSKIYASKIQKGDTYHALTPVIVINILNFKLFHDTEHFDSRLIIKDDLTNIQRMKDFEAYFFELPKLKENCYTHSSKREQWMSFLKNPQKENLRKLAMQNQGIARAVESLEILSHDPNARIAYETRRKAIMDYESGLLASRLEGRLEGLVEGKIEALVEVAKNLKSIGTPYDVITKVTGLSKEEIEKA
ncbi:MAG: Rpn family recombination-promoting nuclease/putative transposase [Bdellovibrionota bacterium]